jgi:hypothetical protein
VSLRRYTRKDGQKFEWTYVHRGGEQHEEDNGCFSGICEKRLLEFHTNTQTHTHTDAQVNCPAPYSLISLTSDAERCELLLASLGKHSCQTVGFCSIFRVTCTTANGTQQYTYLKPARNLMQNKLIT